jgi:hypothetical protein
MKMGMIRMGLLTGLEESFLAELLYSLDSSELLGLMDIPLQSM